MIIIDKLKSYSKYTTVEAELSLLQLLDNMSDEELQAFLLAANNIDYETGIYSIELDREMVSTKQWLEDDYYMGDYASSVYKPWREDLIELFDCDVYDRSLITGSIGCLKSSILLDKFGETSNIRSHVDKKSYVYKGGWSIGKSNGVKKTLLVKFKHGFWTRCTPDHKWLTQNGWVESKDLVPGYHRVKTPRKITIEPKVFDCSEEEAEWIGMMTADGHCRETHGHRFTKSDDVVIERFCGLCDELGLSWKETPKQENARAIYIHTEAYEIIDSHSLRGKRSWEKRVSSRIEMSPNNVVASYLRGIFLDAMWALDKTTYDGKRAVYGVTLGLANEVLIKQTWFLLKRFGIRSRIYSNPNVRENEREMWFCEVRGKPNLLLFDKYIGCTIGKYKDKWSDMIKDVGTKVENTNCDLLPLRWVEAGDWIKRHKLVRTKKWWKWQDSEQGRNKLVSHQSMAQFLEEYPKLKEYFDKVYFDPDCFWEGVVEVLDDGKEVEVFDLIVPDTNYYLADGVYSHNSGKSTFAQLAVLRMLYEASCLRSPDKSYGLAPGSIIGFCNLASSKDTARRVVFEGIASKLRESPYFKYEFPPLKDLKDQILFPKGLSIIAGSSTDSSIIGMNIVGGIIDEVNFFARAGTRSAQAQNASFSRWGHYTRVGRLYESVVRRIKSRYMQKGKLPGILIMTSSKTTHDSFTETLIRKAKSEDSVTMFVRDRNIVDVKRGFFSKETFKVFVGDEHHPSKILDKNEDITQYGENAVAVDVPEDLRPDFESNIDDSLRDLLGVATMAISSFMTRVDMIDKMIDQQMSHPFMCPLFGNPMEWDSRLPYTVHWNKIARRKDNGEWEPIINPQAKRHVGLDPASTGDAFGICIAHIAGMVPVERGKNETTGDPIVESQPLYIVDFMLRVKGEPGSEVLFRNIRKILYQFSEHGFHLAHFSTDSYQSREMIQALTEQGYKAEFFSVDTSKEPYRYLRSVIYDEKVKCYNYPILLNELKTLEETPFKVDHPKDSSKDIADALCAAIWTLSVAGYNVDALAPQKGISEVPGEPNFVSENFEEIKTDDSGKVVKEDYTKTGPKVYVKNKQKTVAPTYKKVGVDGSEEDLTSVRPEDMIVIG